MCNNDWFDELITVHLFFETPQQRLRSQIESLDGPKSEFLIVIGILNSVKPGWNEFEYSNFIKLGGFF